MSEGALARDGKRGHGLRAKNRGDDLPDGQDRAKGSSGWSHLRRPSPPAHRRNQPGLSPELLDGAVHPCERGAFRMDMQVGLNGREGSGCGHHVQSMRVWPQA